MGGEERRVIARGWSAAAAPAIRTADRPIPLAAHPVAGSGASSGAWPRRRKGRSRWLPTSLTCAALDRPLDRNGSRRHVRPAPRVRADDDLRQPRLDRAAVPRALPLGLPVRPRAPGGLGRRDGRRLRAGDARAGARQPPHRRRRRERDGQPGHRVPEQDAAHRHRRPADARDAAARAVSHERRANGAAAAVGQVGASTRAGAGRAGRVHARDRDGSPTARGTGVPVAAAR